LQAPQALVDGYLERGETLGAALTYAMVEVMDDGIGQLDETLRKFGLAENTIVVFASDNGPYLGDVYGVSLERFNYGLRGAKHYVFEGGIRVPALARWPAGLESGRIVFDMVHFTDWLPTLAAAAGVEHPRAAQLDGEDVLPLLSGVSGPVPSERFWQCNRYAPHIEANAAMRDGNWKLVRPADPSLMTVTEGDRAVDRALNYRHADRIATIDRSPLPVFEPGEQPDPLLFDLDSDPFEEHDLAHEHPDRVRRMGDALDRWFESVERDRADAVAAGDLA
jgi:arylsulfatase A